MLLIRGQIKEKDNLFIEEEEEEEREEMLKMIFTVNAWSSISKIHPLELSIELKLLHMPHEEEEED